MIGIYKITSPSGRIYIGQSINLEKRILFYKRYLCKRQIILNSSFLKYGVDNHIFEIIIECDINELNEKERFYQDLYQSTNKSGLNCLLTNTNDRHGKHSEQSKIKMSNSAKGRIPWNKGVKCSEEQKEKIRATKKGSKLSNETILKLKEIKKGTKPSIKCIDKMIEKNSKKIIDKSTGIIYNSITEVASIFGINRTTLNANLIGQIKNKTVFEYYK
jgi:group I intron endonuclease